MKPFLFGFFLLLACGGSGACAQSPEPPVFALSTGDVGKVAILVWDNGRTILELTYSKEKQAEFAKIAGENMGKKVPIVLNGKAVSELTITQMGGHSLKVDQPSPEAALALGKSLFKPKS